MPDHLLVRKRLKPGSRSGGRFFHIELRPSEQFIAFRVQDVARLVALLITTVASFLLALDQVNDLHRSAPRLTDDFSDQTEYHAPTSLTPL